jgi:ABC-type molybdate transport system substrate-binding protein
MDTLEKGSGLPTIPEDREDDVCNLDKLEQADLILFMAGNQFMLMPELLAAFQESCPEVRTIVSETLPPGLELRQILAGGAVFKGQTFLMAPDVYSSVSEEAVQTLIEHGLVDSADAFVYLHNRLALMVRAGNPLGIRTVQDLGREDVVVSQPNPELEHIAAHTSSMYEQAGGTELVQAIFETKRALGTTLMTTVHHRETPRRLISGEADVGPVWSTEIIEAARAGLHVEGVEVGPELDQREKVNYFIAPLRNGQNLGNARRFLDFIRSSRASEIFESYGFITGV